MKNIFTPLLFTAIMLAIAATSARADVSTYLFTAGTGDPYDMSKATVIASGEDECNKISADDNATTAINIGFNFVFDGITYTKFSASTNGLIGLFRSWGNTKVSTCWENRLATATGGCFGPYAYTLDSIPQIAPYWDDMRLPDEYCYYGDGFNGTISYLVRGNAPNRVLVIEYNSVEYSYMSFFTYTTFQTRLYETSNKIEFWYDGFYSGYYSDGGSIGIAGIQGRSFLSVTPGEGGDASVSSTSVNDRIDPSSPEIPYGTLYTFTPCATIMAGNTSQGGTTNMANGDSLLVGKQVQRGNSQAFTPFTATNSCLSSNYTFAITGPHASDYQISPSSGSMSSGSSITPTLTFTPTGNGKRVATLTLTDDKGTNLNYPLAAVGLARTIWTGNVAQGGTVGLPNGDTLMRNIILDRKQTQSYTPITLQNINLSPAQSPLSVQYILDDPTGQYSITPTSLILGANQSSSPIITFHALGVAHQEARLTVIADGEVRTFILFAFSAASGGEVFIGGQKMGPKAATFINNTGCVGSDVFTQAMTVVNTGYGNFTLNRFDVYQTDTLYGQGIPSYPLLRDPQGNPIQVYDYFISTSPGIAPPSANPKVNFPIVIPQGQSITLYITYIGSYPGKRFARAYFYTSGENFLGNDLVTGEEVDGLLNFDLFGRARGATLSNNSDSKPLQPIVFGQTRVGDSAFATFPIMNTGTCELQISKRLLGIAVGDVNEFHVVSALPQTPLNGENYVLAVGATDSITVRFIPSRGGSRRASLRLQTNDSTVLIPSLTERGNMYMDLYGLGKAGIDVKDVVFDPAIIDATTSKAVAEAVNSSAELQTITGLSIRGLDATEFTEDPANPWPTVPHLVLPGEMFYFSIIHTPIPGSQPGARQAILDITMSNGDVFSILLSGIAATRSIKVTPLSLFDNTSTNVGRLARQMVRIENDGTVILTIQQPKLSAGSANPGDFVLEVLPRLELAPMQVEYLEVTYAPTTAGASSATIEIASDATNGLQKVQLNAKAARAKQGGGSDGDNASVSSVGGQSATAGGAMLHQSTPNPASAQVEIGYRLPEAGGVELKLYDARGVEVMMLESGHRSSGEHMVRIDVSGLASGVYHYRLVVNGQTISRTLTVTR